MSTIPAVSADFPENMANLSCIPIHPEAQGACSFARLEADYHRPQINCLPHLRGTARALFRGDRFDDQLALSRCIDGFPCALQSGRDQLLDGRSIQIAADFRRMLRTTFPSP
jgi:hypothetical protein